MAYRGLSIPKSYLWFRDSGLFEVVRLLKDRRREARADFSLELSAKGIAAYERKAKKLPSADIKRAEDVLKTAIARERECPEPAWSELSLEQRVEALPEARELRVLVEEFKRKALRNVIGNTYRGPRPKLVEIELVGWPDDEDEYEPLQAPEGMYVVVELPRRAGPGKFGPGAERVRGYAPHADGHALAEIVVREVQKELSPGEDPKAAVKRVADMLEHPSQQPSLSKPSHPFLEETMRAYASEPIRLVPEEQKPMLLDAYSAFFNERLSYEEIAQRLNDKGYRSIQGKPFARALIENIVIQSLLMVGALEFKGNTIKTGS
jgi:hypothetical protein